MTLYIVVSALIFALAHLRFFHGYGDAIDGAVCFLIIAGATTLSYQGELGTDYSGYLAYYGSFQWMDGRWWEPGFQLLALPAKILDLSYDTFAATCVLLTLTLAYYGVRHLTHNRALFLFALYCLELLSTAFTRQQLAAAVTFVGFSFALRNRFWSFVVASICAMSIHYSSAFFSFFIFFVCFRRNLLSPANLVPVIAIGSAVAVVLVGYLNSARFADQAGVYLTGEFLQGVDGESSFARNVIKYFFYIGCAGAFFLSGVFDNGRGADNNKIQSKTLELMVLFSLFALGLCVLLSPVFSRLSVYLFPLVAVMYGNVFALRNRFSLISYAGIAMAFPVYLYVSLSPIIDYY